MWEGERLDALLRRKRITQADLARILGVGASSVWRWLNNQRTPDDRTKQKIATLLGTTVAHLLGETDDIAPPPDRASGKPRLRTFRETPDGSLVPVGASGDPLQDVLSENPDLEVWFRTRKIFDDDKAAIADLLRRIKDFWEGQEG